jgi:hypothetical protein
MGDWIQFIDTLKTKEDHRDFQKELLVKFQEAYKVNFPKSQATDIILRYRKLIEPSQ